MNPSFRPAPTCGRPFLLALGLTLGAAPATATAATPWAEPARVLEGASSWPAAPRFAQSSPRSAGRVYADHDEAIVDVQRGEVKRLRELLPPAQTACRGVEYIGAEPDMDLRVYRLKFMQAGGRVCWADMDARTGRVIAVRN